MVIGFTQRSRNVSESVVPPGTEIVQLSIAMATLRTSEIGHEVILRHQEQRSTAVVDSIGALTTVNVDAAFGF